LIESHIPPEKSGRRPREGDMREVINGILYLNRTGCSWRMLPHDLPPWGTVHYYYRRFRIDGVWPNIHDRLREQARPTKRGGIRGAAQALDRGAHVRLARQIPQAEQGLRDADRKQRVDDSRRYDQSNASSFGARINALLTHVLR
jgi:putative transposase